MKQVQLGAGLLLFFAAITSCGSQADKALEKDIDRLGTYIDSVKAAAPVYTEDNWEKIQTEYNNTVSKMESAGEKISDDANKKFEAAKAEYNTMKADFDRNIKEAREKAVANDYKMKLRTALFGANQVGADMQFKFMTAGNALQVYDKFVSTVKANQNSYSREDWDEIKVLYEAMDTRKNEIEKELPTAENMKIAKLKVQFASIKSVKRPLAKVEENDDAKQ